jgi:hypothetical protein
MARPKTNSVSRTITFTEDMLENGELVAKRYGVSFPEYVRNLVFNDTRQLLGVEILDEKIEREIAESMRDYENGDCTVLKTDKNIDDHFKKLSQ